MKPLRGIRANRPMKIVKDETGRTRAVVDTAAQEAKLDVSTRIKRRSSKRITVSKNPRPKGG